MAAEDALTTAFYSCSIHQLIPETYEGSAADMYAFEFSYSTSSTSLVKHSCELNTLFGYNDSDSGSNELDK